MSISKRYQILVNIAYRIDLKNAVKERMESREVGFGKEDNSGKLYNIETFDEKLPCALEGFCFVSFKVSSLLEEDGKILAVLCTSECL